MSWDQWGIGTCKSIRGRQKEVGSAVSEMHVNGRNGAGSRLQGEATMLSLYKCKSYIWVSIVNKICSWLRWND